MIFLDELKNLKIYKKQFMFINEKNKFNNAAIILLTPDLISSVNIMNSELINNKYYKSYYLEKDISLILKDNKSLVKEEFLEEKFHLSSPKSVHRSIAIRTRRGINTSLNTKRDLETISDPKEENPEPDAVKKDREENDKEKLNVPTLNINIPEPNIKVGTPASTPAKESTLMETCLYFEEGVHNGYIKDNENILIFNEDAINDGVLRKILYKERLKTSKEVLLKYKEIKELCPHIQYTFLDIDRYKSKNLYVDLSYYNQAYFSNSLYKNKKGLNIYSDLMYRLINATNLSNYTNKLIVVPILDWSTDIRKRAWMYTDEITPISIIYNLLKTNYAEFKKNYKDINFVFLGKDNYFKLDVNQYDPKNLQIFKRLIDDIKNNKSIDYEVMPEDSPKAITAKIVDKIETKNNVVIHNLTGSKSTTNEKEIKDKIDSSTTTDDKDKLVDKINDTAKDSKDIEDTIEKLDPDIVNIINNISTDEKKISSKRQNRIDTLNKQLMTKSIKGRTVKEILDVEYDKELPETSLDIDTINKDDWNHLTFNSFDKEYDVNDDIIGMLYSLQNMSYPIYIRDINIDNISTSEDYVNRYTVQMEDLNGKRFTIKFDIPIVEDNYMMLRGNRKTMSNQLFLKPIIETDEDVVQIVSNYNKIFIKRYGKISGKSIVFADKLMKTLNSDLPNLEVVYCDNTKICSNYALPIDYIDLASVFSRIEVRGKDKYTIYFNQDEIREKYKDKIDDSKGIPCIYDYNNKQILYYNNDKNTMSEFIYYVALDGKPEIMEKYNSVKPSSKYTYSKASILNTDIPVIIICAYSEGLEPVLNKANINYVITEKKSKDYSSDPSYDSIKFSDGILYYRVTYSSSLLMNGLKESPTDLYSISEINKKGMYIDFLDNYGGRLKADGLDNFYDLMIDSPITTDVLKHYNCPTDYVELLIYANNLLADNNFNRHVDMDGKRLRRNEIIAGYFYKALSDSYKAYSLELKHGRKEAALIMKPSAVIDKIMVDPTQQDTSLTTVLLDAEYNNTVSTKGLSGMNSDRSYSLDKRTYDESMQNVIAMATGFAGNVGVARQLTIDANVKSSRGYIDIDTNPDHISTTKTYCYTEALTPFGCTHDDPFRSAMTFTQTSKHNVRVQGATPMLITNGTDEAIPYLSSNVFAYKAKDKGTIKEITDSYMIIEYSNGTNDYIDLSERIEKNSNSGAYVTIKLDTDYKVGKKFKKNEILAYDRLSFDRSIGPTDNLAYSGTVLTKCALMQTDEGYEDSAIVSDKLCEKLMTEIVFKKDVYVPANTNIYNLVKIGQEIQEGENLLIMQTPYDEEEANRLLKYLADDDEVISDLGRIPIKSKITGTVQDIRISRTVEKSELSDSLKKICNTYEKGINEKKKVMQKYKIDKEYTLDPTYKLEPTGKLKNCPEGVLIEIFLKEHVKFGIGDKIVYYSANKGVTKTKFPTGKEPYSEFRPEEEVSSLVAVGSQQGRMVTSIVIVGGINKALIELDRANKEELGIPIDYDL